MCFPFLKKVIRLDLNLDFCAYPVKLGERETLLKVNHFPISPQEGTISKGKILPRVKAECEGGGRGGWGGVIRLAATQRPLPFYPKQRGWQELTQLKKASFRRGSFMGS